MPEKWIKNKKSKNGFTYRKEIRKKREYWRRERYNPFNITFPSDLVKRGFYNDDS